MNNNNNEKTLKEVDIMKCSKHKTYKAIKAPTAKCKECRMLYVSKHRDKTVEKLGIELGVSEKTVRNYEAEMGFPNRRITIQSTRNDVPFEEMVLKFLKKKRRTKVTIVDIANYFDRAPSLVKQALETLAENNKIALDQFPEGELKLANDLQPIEQPYTIDTSKYGEREFCIGAVADTHIGSKYERNDVLEALYDKFAEAGVENVYHGGNWIDGEARFNKYDIYVHGVEAQVNNFIEKYPQREGIKTFIISGDDHEGWYVQREHVNIGKYMESKAREAGRDDLIDLGYIERDIEFKTEKGSSILRVIHAGGGSSYAISYTSQKYVESLQGGEKPAIVIAGHYHKFDYSYPREVHVIQPGCTEDQTPFMRKRKLQAMIGGCIIWIKQNELGVFTSVKVEWIPFYDKKFYQYKW